MSVNTLATVRDGFFDTHAHYNDPRMRETFGDVDAWIKHLLDENVAYILNAATDLQTAAECLSLAEKFAPLYAAVGIHPSDAGAQKQPMQEVLSCVKQLLAHPKAVAVGEIGLDFHYGKDTKEEQIELFRKQLRIGMRHQVPVMIHTRDANQLTLDILKEEGLFSEERKAAFPMRPDENGQPVPDARVQLHCFSGSAELAKEYVALGATISIGGPVTFKNGRKTVEVAKQVPIEFIMTETDAPYLTPEPFRGRPNRSPYIEHIIRRIALIKDMEYEAAEEILYANGCRFFDIPRDEKE